MREIKPAGGLKAQRTLDRTGCLTAAGAQAGEPVSVPEGGPDLGAHKGGKAKREAEPKHTHLPDSTHPTPRPARGNEEVQQGLFLGPPHLSQSGRFGRFVLTVRAAKAQRGR